MSILIGAGEGYANLLEFTGALTVAFSHVTAWKRENINFTELARKRWVEKYSMDRLALDLGYGRTAVVKYINQIKLNPSLVEDGQVRSRVYLKKRLFMGH